MCEWVNKARCIKSDLSTQRVEQHYVRISLFTIFIYVSNDLLMIFGEWELKYIQKI